MPRSRKSAIVDSCFYRIIDFESGKVIVPFDKKTNSTRVSVDADGLFIKFHTDGLPKNRIFHIDLLINDMGIERLIKLSDVAFKVV